MMFIIGLWLLIGLIGLAVYFAAHHRREMAALTPEQRAKTIEEMRDQARYW